MGTSESAELQPGRLAARSFAVLQQDPDPRYGPCRLIRFEDDPHKVFLHKAMPRPDPTELDESLLLARALRRLPRVSPVVHLAPSEDGRSLDLVSQCSLDSLERRLGARALREEEVWQLYDFLVDAGADFEHSNEYFFEICSKDLLYFGDSAKVCSQYLYEKYALTAVRLFSADPLPPEAKKALVRIWRYNVKRLGIFLLEVCLRRATKIDTKNALMIEQEAARMKHLYSPRLCKLVAALAFNLDGLVFSALKKANQLSAPEDLPRRLPAASAEPREHKQLRLQPLGQTPDPLQSDRPRGASPSESARSHAAGSFVNANPKPFETGAPAPGEHSRPRHESYSERKVVLGRAEEHVRRHPSERPSVRSVYTEHAGHSVPQPLKVRSLPEAAWETRPLSGEPSRGNAAVG